ncbi:MAG: mechanosensitive ion channel [Leptospiraceae bacterium]|nr:mechanosensitive ion channel [Leptospiraceae bacterium]
MEIFKFLNPKRAFLGTNDSIIDNFVTFFYLLIFLLLAYQITKYFLKKHVHQEDLPSFYNKLKITRYIYSLVGFLGLISVFYTRIVYLPTILALTAAGLVISLKDVTLNFVGWIMIHNNNGFKVGDRMEIDGVKGDVVNIGIMKFTLLEVNREESTDQSTNRLIHIPNHAIIIKNIHLSTSQMDYLWDEIKIQLSYSSDWEKAEEICNTILKEMFDVNNLKQNIEKKLLKISENYMLKLGKTSPIVYTTIDGSKIILSLRYLTRVHEKRNNRTNISRKILHEFKKHPNIVL